MYMILLSLGLLSVASIVSLFAGRHVRECSIFSATMAVLAAGLGILPCLSVLAGHPPLTLLAHWEIPFGAFALRLDALSAFFLLPIFGLGALAAVYGTTYLPHAIDRKHLGVAWFCFHLLMASMVTVILAANGLLFLLAWELTVLSSFVLVVLGSDSESNRQAGWVYLTASHLGAGFLVVLFLLMGRETGSLDFAGFSGIASLPAAFRGTLFLLAVIGFGTKAGFLPLHVWLPEAHPAAPSNVSALMSGVMIKTGIYGLVRILFFLGHPELWWGWTLLIIGLISGILGVLFALSQNDLKRLLAYSSVENVGIVTLGLGLGLIGLSHGQLGVAAFGLAGGLLHVLNHAVFKGLLFLGAGAVLEQTGTRDIDRLGGLLKHMPWTGSSFLVGCLSISGLPPFNGFISEFLIYVGALLAIMGSGPSLVVAGLLIIAGLPLIGGLAAACFAKAFSVVFLGIPRESCATTAHEVSLPMRLPMAVLAALCLLIAMVSPYCLEALARVVSGHPDASSITQVMWHLSRAYAPLVSIVWGAFLLLLLLGGVLAWRRHLLAGREIGQTCTWDCGYAKPAGSMQYTGSSFAQPIVDLFEPVLKTRSHLDGVDGYFPRHARFASHTHDLFLERVFSPAFRGISAVLHLVTPLQNGVVQAYVLYITITLIVLLIGSML